MYMVKLYYFLSKKSNIFFAKLFFIVNVIELRSNLNNKKNNKIT